MRQVLVQEANDPDSATLDGEAHGNANRLAKTPWFIPLCGVLGLFGSDIEDFCTPASCSGDSWLGWSAS